MFDTRAMGSYSGVLSTYVFYSMVMLSPKLKAVEKLGLLVSSLK